MVARGVYEVEHKLQEYISSRDLSGPWARDSSDSCGKRASECFARSVCLQKPPPFTAKRSLFLLFTSVSFCLYLLSFFLLSSSSLFFFNHQPKIFIISNDDPNTTPSGSSSPPPVVLPSDQGTRALDQVQEILAATKTDPSLVNTTAKAINTVTAARALNASILPPVTPEATTPGRPQDPIDIDVSGFDRELVGSSPPPGRRIYVEVKAQRKRKRLVPNNALTADNRQGSFTAPRSLLRKDET
ncbi:hypothetical protein VHEMI10738 [[Torrubiella] hemipterigena]|uniref:Uncharacterized protein n=1 Tax=[Torrubiella] hemipterigena TaxID=1531966 RepID=A0A0A1TTP0_9HYPO|nr:hypothetical protein VHEMI10738 [[Torrubiella] hemipterigena]